MPEFVMSLLKLAEISVLVCFPARWDNVTDLRDGKNPNCCLTCDKCDFNQCHHIPGPLSQVLFSQTVNPLSAALSTSIRVRCNLKAVLLTETEHPHRAVLASI